VKVEPVKIGIERRVRAGAESAFKDWSHIRTFLSFSLEVEINGRWPWQGDEGKRPASEQSG
jgi:hypothetical protein